MTDSDNPFDRSGQPSSPPSDNPFDRSGADNPFDRSGAPDAESDDPFDRSGASAADSNNPFDRSGASTDDEPAAQPGAPVANDAKPLAQGGSASSTPDAPKVEAAAFESKDPVTPTANATGEAAAVEALVKNQPKTITNDTGSRRLRALDLTGREKQLRESMSIMNRVAVGFARAARKTLPFLVWRKSHLVPQPVAISAAPGAATEPTGPSLHAIYEEAIGTAWACVSLNDTSLGLILEGALGGAESKGGFSFGKELTLAQRALAGRLIKSLGDDLTCSIRAETDVSLDLEGVYACPPESLQDVLRTDGLSVDCTVEGVPGALITISVQAAALESAIRDQEEETPQQGDPRMKDVVMDVPVQVVAELGRISLGLRKVLRLEEGQVLRLSTAVDDPVRIDVAGLKKFVGVPVVSRGQLAVEIKGRVGD